MSGLFTMLRSAASALDAQRYGLDVTGHNIANVNTPGYSRRRVSLSEVAPPDVLTAGGGVRVDGVVAERNRFLERRIRNEFPAEQRQDALAEALSQVELGLADNGGAINDRLTAFFDAFARLADLPTSSTARQEVILRGRELGSAFRGASSSLTASQQELDAEVRATLDSINALATTIARLNEALGNLDPTHPEALQLQDQVRHAVEELSKLTSIDALERPTGGFDVSIGSGRSLVVGTEVYALSAASRPVTGLADVVAADGTVITTQIGGGRLKGTLDARDTLVPGYRTALDQLAYTVVTAVNTLHTGGYDSSGTAGQPFFQALGTSTNAASLIDLNPALAADGGETLVAASNDPTAAGDNGAARAVAALRDARLLAGGTATPTDYWSQIVYRVGRDTQAARDEHRTRAALVRQAESLRESASGVSLDEEAANLMRFQRAYEANARFFRSVDETLATLLRMVGA
jgi:flagellar hook-associated protein 1 FlgK